MKSSNASILLEKYQNEKRRRILRYSSQGTHGVISTPSTRTHSKLSSSRISSNVDNFELSFLLSSYKAISTPGQPQPVYHIDGACRFHSSKENKTPRSELKRLLARTPNAIVHLVPEKLASRYFKNAEAMNKQAAVQSDLENNATNQPFEVKNLSEEYNKKKSPTKSKQGDQHISESEQRAELSLQTQSRRRQINSVLDSISEDANVIPATLCQSDIENTPIKKKRGNQIGGNRTSLLIATDNPFGILEQLDEVANEALPFTMKEFPEDVNPADFFQQKQSTYHPYIESVRKSISYTPTFSLYHFHKDFNVFFSPFTILSKSSKGVTTKSYFNLSASYFLVNCSEVVQLYFAYEMIMYFLNSKRSIPLFITHKDFDRVLSKLSGEVDLSARISVLSKKSIQRKSMFSNHKVNFLIEDFDDNPDNPEESNPQKTQPDGQDVSLAITPFSVSGLANQQLAQVKEVRGEISESGSDDDSKSRNSGSSNSDSDSDKSDSESSGDSLDETEYSTKNPFVLKYSKIVYKFQTYEVKMIPATVNDAEGHSERLTSEMIFDLLYGFNNFNYDFFVQ